MPLIFTVIVTVCFVASLLPFLFPGALIGFLGKLLNDALGDPVWNLVPAGRGILAANGPAGPVLTLKGVLAVYIPLLLAALWVGQRR